MATVDMKADMAEAVGMIQFAGGEDRMQEWCSVMMAHI